MDITAIYKGQYDKMWDYSGTNCLMKAKEKGF